MQVGPGRGPLGRAEIVARAEVLEAKANRLALGNAEERWESSALLRDAAEARIRAFEAIDVGACDAATYGRERALARVEAVRLFLAARDPVRARRQWALLPREAFDIPAVAAGAPKDGSATTHLAGGPASVSGAATDRDRPMVAVIAADYAERVTTFERDFRAVLGPDAARSMDELRDDQLRALAHAYPGVPELWWALGTCSRSPGEADLALARVLRLSPDFVDPRTGEKAFLDLEASLALRFRVELASEARSGRLALEVASRITVAFASLLSGFIENTVGSTPELAPHGAPRALAGGRRMELEIAAFGAPPFALEELDRDLRSTLSRSDAGARVTLLSLLQEHRIRLTASPLAPPDQAGLCLDEEGRSRALATATADALARVDSREIPQADDVERVFRIVERIAKGKGDPTDISPRQISYYRRAAKILGFLTEDESLTPGGHLVSRLDREERLRVAAVRFEGSACGGAWVRWSGGRTLLDVDPSTAVDFLRTSAPGLGKDTCERRAQTLIAWHRALAPHHYRRAA